MTENPPAPAAYVASYDVLVGAQSVRLIPRYAAEVESCRPTGVEVFPAVGECTDQGDAISIPCGIESNITQVSVDGVPGSLDPLTASGEILVNTSATSMLRIDGAFGAADIPLHAIDLPTPTISTTPTANGVDIAWTTDTQMTSALVEVTTGLIVRRCHVPASPCRFDGQASNIRVQPFLPFLSNFSPPYVEIRVWRGNGRVAD